jgi:type IV pilus assembly protein PilE
MNSTLPFTRSRSARRVRCNAGFTLIETMVTIGIAGVLSSVAYPSLEGQVMRARRSDALVALMQAQLAQERFRANNARYGTLADAGVGPISPAGHYRIVLLASAVAGQSRDTRCRHLRLALADATLTYASGSDATTANGADANRACWTR